MHFNHKTPKRNLLVLCGVFLPLEEHVTFVLYLEFQFSILEDVTVIQRPKNGKTL